MSLVTVHISKVSGSACWHWKDSLWPAALRRECAAPLRAAQAAPVPQEVRAGRELRQPLVVGSLGEGRGASGKAGVVLASVNNFSALWSMGTAHASLGLDPGDRARWQWPREGGSLMEDSVGGYAFWVGWLVFERHALAWAVYNLWKLPKRETSWLLPGSARRQMSKPQKIEDVVNVRKKRSRKGGREGGRKRFLFFNTFST